MANTNRKNRGRTSITEKMKGKSGASTRPNLEQERRSEASRPVAAGAGRHRGDRRDMNKAYTGNERHAARGNTPRVNVSTRKA